MALAHQYTLYHNIFRTFDAEESEFLWNSFLNEGENLCEFFKDNAVKITEHILNHTQFTKNNLIPRTSNQAERFHSIPVVRQIKNKCKSPEGFLQCMAVIMEYYYPKSRKKIRPE